MSKIAVFYHGLFYRNLEFQPNCFNIAQAQMGIMQASGLTDTADEIYCGVNGGEESVPFAESIFPEKAEKVYHSLQCRNEIRTIMHMQRAMSGRQGWKVLYFHCKGAFHSPEEKLIVNWRNCMMRHLVYDWPICINSLSAGFESAGCHWKTGQVNGTMSLWGGNFFWLTSDFLATLPPIENNARLPVMGGIDSVQSRYEAEVWIGNGPRLPRVVDYHPSGPFTCGG
jgi:hypothetical protein